MSETLREARLQRAKSQVKKFIGDFSQEEFAKKLVKYYEAEAAHSRSAEPDEWEERYDFLLKEVTYICGIHPRVATEAEKTLGCGREVSREDVFRCWDCGTPFHKSCLKKHCAAESNSRSAPDREAHYEETMHRWLPAESPSESAPAPEGNKDYIRVKIAELELKFSDIRAKMEKCKKDKDYENLHYKAAYYEAQICALKWVLERNKLPAPEGGDERAICSCGDHPHCTDFGCKDGTHCLICSCGKFSPVAKLPAPEGITGAQIECGKPTKYHLIAGASSYACMLAPKHDGECQPGGKCVAHGKYVGATQCPKWPDCVKDSLAQSSVREEDFWQSEYVRQSKEILQLAGMPDDFKTVGVDHAIESLRKRLVEHPTSESGTDVPAQEIERVIRDAETLLEWVPTCSPGSSGYIRTENLRKSLADLKFVWGGSLNGSCRQEASRESDTGGETHEAKAESGRVEEQK